MLPRIAAFKVSDSVRTDVVAAVWLEAEMP